jgi:hypothetical protein
MSGNARTRAEAQLFQAGHGTEADLVRYYNEERTAHRGRSPAFPCYWDWVVARAAALAPAIPLRREEQHR